MKETNEKASPKKPSRKRKPRPILWQPSEEQEKLIRVYQDCMAQVFHRPTRADTVSSLMSLGFISWEHERIKWTSSQKIEEEPDADDAEQRIDALLARIKAKLPDLEKWFQIATGWSYEDGVYRFYHQSFKVFSKTTGTLTAAGIVDRSLQNLTRLGFDLLEAIADGRQMNTWFLQIYQHGQAFQFDMNRSNTHWLEETRPILESFWHVRYFVEQMIKYAKELERAPDTLPSGWAAVLYLYRMR